jgi:predicted ABC-type ATPase
MKINEITQITKEGVYDPNIFKAVFMAGAPGAGKSTVVSRLFRGSGLKELNVDKFWTLYQKKGQPQDYEKFWQHYRKEDELSQKGRMGLIVNGTAKNPNVIKEIKETLESRGYETIMVFVDVTLETSIERAERRAQVPGPDYGREIDHNFIKTTYDRIQQGAEQLKTLFGDRFFVVDNNGEQPNFNRVERPIRRWLNTPVKNPTAQAWIDNELQARNRSRDRAAQQPAPPPQQTTLEPKEKPGV